MVGAQVRVPCTGMGGMAGVPLLEIMLVVVGWVEMGGPEPLLEEVQEGAVLE